MSLFVCPFASPSNLAAQRQRCSQWAREELCLTANRFCTYTIHTYTHRTQRDGWLLTTPTPTDMCRDRDANNDKTDTQRREHTKETNRNRRPTQPLRDVRLWTGTRCLHQLCLCSRTSRSPRGTNLDNKQNICHVVFPH